MLGEAKIQFSYLIQAVLEDEIAFEWLAFAQSTLKQPCHDQFQVFLPVVALIVMWSVLFLTTGAVLNVSTKQCGSV